MTDEYPHQLERFRDFAYASRSLCQTLSLSEPYQNRELLSSILSALGNFPDELCEDDVLIGILDALVDDGFPSDSYLAEPWGGFLLRLGFLHLRRYERLNDPQDIQRALIISQLARPIVSRDRSPRLWASFQLLIGDSKQRLWPLSGDSALEPLKYYHNALEVIQRETDPVGWVNIATRIGYAYAELTAGDRNHNLRTSADFFMRIRETCEYIGSKRGVADANIALGDVLTALNDNDNELVTALESYHHAYAMLQRIGDEREADKIARKIKLLETVSFTVYYPRIAIPDKKYGWIVYAHLPELQSDINHDIQKFSMDLGDSLPAPRRSRSTVKLERGTLITVVPECREVEFDPPELTKKWDGSWTRFLFDFKVAQELVGEVVLVRISIQAAGIEIASINNCAIEIIESQEGESSENPLASAKLGNKTSTLYQRIFVSYSRKDGEIAERYKLAQTALGNEAFIDVDDLRAGENWKTGLAKAIDVADVFQLFWSRNSANSEYCRYEWNYALEYRCTDGTWEGFVRPVYWEKPMPEPPLELSNVNFKYVPFGGNAKLQQYRTGENV